MSWKALFKQGISSFRDARYEDALQYLTETVDSGGDQQFVVYDSRAATYEKLGKLKEALRDARKAIELAPDRWQGYARAAKLFLSVQKLDASLMMADMALDRIKEGDNARRVELSNLKDDIQEAQKVVGERQNIPVENTGGRVVAGSRQSAQYHFGKLPVELMGEIFSLIVDKNPDRLLVLLRICQRWRNTIWYTPSLWSILILSHRNPRQKASQWVDRSNGHIRELYVKAPAVEHRHWPCDALTRVKWDRLRVCSVESWDVARYLEGMSLKHILGHLATLVVDDHGVVPHILRDPLFVEGSAVHSLTMVHATFSWDTFSTCFSKLVHLDVRDCHTTGDLVSALAANPILETLVIEAQSFPPPLSQTTVELPNLVHLELAGAGLLNVTNCLTFPNLQKLFLRRGSLALDAVFHNIRPSGLLELSIIQSLVSASRFINFLREATSLKSLEMSHLSDIANEIVEALSTPPQPSNSAANAIGPNTTAAARLMCPSLAHLNVSYCPGIQTGSLVRLIRARLPKADLQAEQPVPTIPEQKLVSLRADGCDLIDPEWIPWFRSNVQKFSCTYMTKKGASWKR